MTPVTFELEPVLPFPNIFGKPPVSLVRYVVTFRPEPRIQRAETPDTAIRLECNWLAGELS